MKITTAQKLTLYALEQCYAKLNQPLEKSPVEINVSKITFIELVLNAPITLKQERALYKNLETLEQKQLIKYNNKRIIFTPLGLEELNKIQNDIKQFLEVRDYFLTIEKPSKKLQTIIRH